MITYGPSGFDDLLVDLKAGVGFMYFPREDSRFYYQGSLGYILSGRRRYGSWVAPDPTVTLGVVENRSKD